MDEVTERRWRQARAKARLKALGVDVETMPREQIRRMWESVRASYVNNATAGLHFEPMNLDGDPLPGACLHARVGVFVDALREVMGEWPADWPHHRIDWPRPGQDPAGGVTVTAAQVPPRELPR